VKTWIWCLLIPSITLVGCPGGAVPSDHLVMVSQAGSSTVIVIDPDQQVVVKRLTVGGLPHRLQRLGERVYAVLTGSQAIAEIDIKSLNVTRTILTSPVPSTRSDGSRIEAHFQTNAFSSSTCFVCHSAQGGTKPFIVGTRPVGLSFTSDEKLIVSQIRAPQVVILNPLTTQLEQQISFTSASLEASDVARVGENIAVSVRSTQPSTQAGELRFYNKDLMLLEQQPTGSDPSFVLPLGNSGALVSNFESNSVSQYVLGQAAIRFEVTPGPLGMRLLTNNRVLTLNYYSNQVSILELDTGAVHSYPLVWQGQVFVNPTNAAISPDGKFAYIVSSGTDAHLLRFDLESKQVTSAMSIDGLSFDVLVIPRE
jgi:DNA-binding beta-propeller fold protein YncE